MSNKITKILHRLPMRNEKEGAENQREQIEDRQYEKTRKLSNKRRIKNGSYSMLLTAVVIAGAVAVNLIVSELPSQFTKIDVSEQQLSVLSDRTKEFLSDLDQDITIYYIVQDGNRDTNISRILERYEDLSSHIIVEEKDPVLYPNFSSQFTDESLSDNSVIVTCGDVNRVIAYDSMYESEFNYNYYSYETTGFDGEGQITSAIAAVISEDMPKLYTLTGHGELELNSTLEQSIVKENIEVASLNLLTEEQVPEDADCLLIDSPSSDLSDAEAQKILCYLKTGGKAVIITDYMGKEMENLSSILAYYGVSLVDGVVVEGNSNYYIQVPYYVVPDINSIDVSSEMAGGSNYILLAAAQGIQTLADARESLSIASVLSTSDSAYSKVNVENMSTYEKEEEDIDGPFDLGVLISETVELTDELLEEVNGALESANDTVSLGNRGLSAETDDGGAGENRTDNDAEGRTAEGAAEAVSEAAEKSAQEDASGSVTEAEVSSEEENGTVEEAVSEEENGIVEEAMPEEESKTAAEAMSEEVSETAAKEASEKDIDTAETKLAVFSSSTLLDASADQMVSGGNSKLFMNTLSWICGHSSAVSVPVKSMSVSYLTLTSASSSFWSIVVIAVIPGAFLVGGLFIWMRRRKK